VALSATFEGSEADFVAKAHLQPEAVELLRLATEAKLNRTFGTAVTLTKEFKRKTLGARTLSLAAGILWKRTEPPTAKFATMYTSGI
jgi:histone H3/H4